MEAYIAVGTTSYRPEFSIVPFSVNASDMRFELSVPRWDTHRSYGAEEIFEVGKIAQLEVKGSYRYYAEPKPEHQETLTLHLEV